MAIKLYKSQVNVSKQQSSVPTAKLEGDFGQAVFRGQQQLLNTTMQIEQRHRSMQEDKDVIEQTTKYNEDLNEIVVNHNKLNNYDEGMMSYETATNELLTNTTANIKNNNVKRRVEEHALRHNSAYKIDIGKNIRTNNTKIFKDSLDLKKNESFNTILTSNPALQTQMRDELFIGPNSFYNQELNAGTLAAGVTEETYNQSLQDQYETAEANYLIISDVNKFLTNDQKGIYNNLDPLTLIPLRNKAQVALNKLNTKNNINTTNETNDIKFQINNIEDFINSDVMPNPDEVSNLLVRAKKHNVLLKSLNKSNLDNEIAKLNNTFEVLAHSFKFKQNPIEEIIDEKNKLDLKIKITQGTDKINLLDVHKKESLEKLEAYREANEDTNLLEVGSQAGLLVKYQNDEGETIQSLTEIDFSQPTENIAKDLAVRTNQAILIASPDGLNKDVPQYLTENERNDLVEKLQNGTMQDYQNIIANIAFVSGDNAPVAFDELSLINYTGLSQIGYLYTQNGNKFDSNLNNAINAMVKMQDPNVKNRLAKFNPLDDGHINNQLLFETIHNHIGQFVKNPIYGTSNSYQKFSEATELIFKGKIILSDIYQQDFATATALGNNQAVQKMLHESLQIVTGYGALAQGHGGMEEYNGHMIAVPLNHLNAYENKKYGFNPPKNAISVEELMKNFMTEEMFDKATQEIEGPFIDNKIYFGDDRIEGSAGGDKEFAKLEDLMDSKYVSMIEADESGTYLFIYGDPKTSNIVAENKNRIPIRFNLNAIYPELLKKYKEEN